MNSLRGRLCGRLACHAGAHPLVMKTLLEWHWRRACGSQAPSLRAMDLASQCRQGHRFPHAGCRSISPAALALLGPSGSGKTTLLRLIAGSGSRPRARSGSATRMPRRERQGTQYRLRVPELCAVPPYDGSRQYRLRAQFVRCLAPVESAIRTHTLELSSWLAPAAERFPAALG
jgi:hypothetical protein